MLRYLVVPLALAICAVTALAGGTRSPSPSPSPTIGGTRSPTVGVTRSPNPISTPSTQPMPRAVGETWTNARGIKFAYIPAGEFLMGSPEKETGRHADETPHRVTLSKPFLLGIYEVTQGQWKAIQSGNPSSFTGDDLPIDSISWTEAASFCQRLSNDGYTYRLPTEAEWEYACRAGTTTVFNTGDTISTDQANFNGLYPYGDGKKGVAREKTMPAGSFKPNAWGLYDMHGNVWEWCGDWLADYPAGAVTDPKGPASGGVTNQAFRIMRGGAFGYVPLNCRSAVRNFNEAKGVSSSVGFRLAVDIR